MSQSSSLQKIRQENRRKRRSLSPVEQDRAALALARRLQVEPIFRNSDRIAFYLAQDGEIDPIYLLSAATAMGKLCYLPRLKPDHSIPARNLLWFFRYTPGDPLSCNRFGILEPLPDSSRYTRPEVLDLVLLPLVAFDELGDRLGMGRGYYDQTFAFSRTARCWRRPRMIGLAHQCQQVNRLQPNPWDLPLDSVATDHRISHFPRQSQRAKPSG